jgi:TolA-binding protein
MKPWPFLFGWFVLALTGTSIAQTGNVSSLKSDPAAASQRIRTQIRKSQITPLVESGTVEPSSESLKEWTDQLVNLRLPSMQSLNTKPAMATPSTETVKPEAVSESKNNTGTSSSKPQSPNSAKPVSVSANPPNPTPVIADPVMAVLAMNPQSIVDLFSAAEALYTKKDYPRAANLYRKLMDEIGDNREIQNRSWVIFQYGNCTRKSKPAEADAIYAKLIAEHPDSDWAGVAKSRQNWIEWSMQNKPESLLAKYGYDPNSL